VTAFKEKPDAALAGEYIRDERYSWNSGVFFAAPALLLDEFGIAAGDIRDAAREALRRASRDGPVIRLDPELFSRVRPEAVDRAVMEKTRRAAVAPCDIGWADIGSWPEVLRLSAKDASGNATDGPVMLADSRHTLVRSDGIQVSVLGVSGLVIVASGNSVLVMAQDSAQDVKKVIPGAG
jgi:mannose-1-phosphate guanylyltransferase / mannose-6-phosphate isomerase